ncbi:MAG TPA: condensation domain-containing protein, partial [Pirellulales bacterium]|nr:condensation domain-containing protein [Pirellulales bacterium]
EVRTNAFIARQSYRRFDASALTLAKVGDWLGAAQTMPIEGALLPKRRYASAGGLYPVRLYLLVKPDSVEGLDSGAYVYDPFDHALVRVGETGFDASAFDSSNLAIAKGAALAIVFVSHLPAILPLYGEWGKAACLIEAGALAHALAEHGLAQGIGSCVVGGADDVALRSALGLADATTDSLLHVLLAGAVTDEQQSQVSPLSFGTAAAVTSDELREWLLARLPDYMVPATFVTVHALPLTPNGKLDRKSLPAPYGPADDNEYVPPATLDEVLLCDLVADLLGHKRVGLQDNFFHLGGHSLSAARLAAQIRARVGRELSIQSIFDKPKLGTLASVLREAPKVGPRLAAYQRSGHLPLSFAQTRLWFLNRLDTTGAQYNIPIAMRIQGRLNRIALEAALNDVVARHESLRTLIVDGDEGPRQHVLPPAADRINLGTRQCAASSCDGLLKALAAQGFDLSHDIPLRATLLSLDDDTSVLLLVVHHSAADAWSVAPILNDLAQAYAARRANSRFTFQALPIQYGDFALWQRDQDGMPGDRLTDQIRYWRETLSDQPVELALPYDRPRPSAPSSAGGTVPISISTTLHERLHAVALTHGVTLFMVLQAGIAALLAKLGGGSKVPIGTPISGRDEVMLEEMVGFFVNTLVLCTDVSGDPSFEQLLRRARSVCLDAYAHKDVAFERLVEILDPPRAIGRQPLFQTMLAFNAMRRPRPELAGVTASLIPVRVDAAKFDLSFDFTETEDGLDAALEYSAALFNHATAEAIASRCVRLFELVASDPGARLSRIDILSVAERSQVLND